MLTKQEENSEAVHLILRLTEMAKNQATFEKMVPFGSHWEFCGAIHETRPVLKRDPRRNFMENFLSLRFSVGMQYKINANAQLCKWI
jgi:hypothetical protein